MTTLYKLVIGSFFGLTLTASSAQSMPSFEGTAHGFSTPTFERLPLSQTLSPDEYWETVANNAFIAQDYQNSIAAYGKAIELAQVSDRPELFAERGWVYYRLGKFERADADFRQAASLHQQQNRWEAYRNIRQIRQFVGDQADRISSAS